MALAPIPASMLVCIPLFQNQPASQYPADHDKVFVVDASSGPITVTLPVATPNGFRIHVKKIDPTANAVTVDADGTDTIDGSLTAVISGQNDSIPINSDGTNWVLL